MDDKNKRDNDEPETDTEAGGSTKRQALLMVVLGIVVFILLLAFYLFKLNPVAFKYQGY